ncbi:MAG TPA: hypothetical protein VM869_22955 [Enhygromyxa sp.]|nr:hypothetical protein [Enhygromyxa sp.]
MPSPLHQNFVLLFDNHPELTFELARRAGAPLPLHYQRFEPSSAEFEDPVTGTLVRADLAIVGHVNRHWRRGVVLEVQLDTDPDKEWTLALYRGGIRRKHRCPAWVVLFSPDPNVRRSVQEQMFVFEPELRPYVITPEMIPIVQDLQAALDNYAWAVLAAAVHNTGPEAVVGATVAIRALLRIAPSDHERYIQLVSASVGDEVMQQVRAQLPPDEQIELSEFERRGSTYTRAHREGFAEGLEQGLDQGLERGRAAVLGILAARELAIDEHTRERIAACSDLDQLSELLIRAATIATADALFSTH